MEEEERPLMPRTDISGDNQRIQRRVSLRGALGVFFCALVLFILSYLASRSIFYSESETVAFDLDYSENGLVSPRNGSHPALTSTSECTTAELPVLAGADVVEYFSLTEGSKPVMADGSIRSMHGGYLFFFNSVDNRRAFEAHLPIREGGLGLTSSSSIKGAAYIICHALVLGRVVASSARGDLPSLLERQPERPMASALIEELKTVATEA